MHGMACPVIIVTDYAYWFFWTTAETKPPAPNVHSQNMKFCRNCLLFTTQLFFLCTSIDGKTLTLSLLTKSNSICPTFRHSILRAFVSIRMLERNTTSRLFYTYIIFKNLSICRYNFK